MHPVISCRIAVVVKDNENNVKKASSEATGHILCVCFEAT